MALASRERLAAHFSQQDLVTGKPRPVPFAGSGQPDVTRDLGYGTIRFTRFGNIKVGLLDHTRSATMTIRGADVTRIPAAFTTLGARVGVDKVVGAGVIV